jgi:hypothetical protein
MKRNIELNGLGPSPPTAGDLQIDADSISIKADEVHGRVRVNEGDAWFVILI